MLCCSPCLCFLWVPFPVVPLVSFLHGRGIPQISVCPLMFKMRYPKSPYKHSAWVGLALPRSSRSQSPEHKSSIPAWEWPEAPQDSGWMRQPLADVTFCQHFRWSVLSSTLAIPVLLSTFHLQKWDGHSCPWCPLSWSLCLHEFIPNTSLLF